MLLQLFPILKVKRRTSQPHEGIVNEPPSAQKLVGLARMQKVHLQNYTKQNKG